MATYFTKSGELWEIWGYPSKATYHSPPSAPDKGLNTSWQAHDVNITSPQRRCNVMTSCARWDEMTTENSIMSKTERTNDDRTDIQGTATEIQP